MDAAAIPRTPMLARRLGPSGRRPGRKQPGTAPQPTERQRRRLRPRPTRGPGGEVRWWERPAPGGDEALWAAVQLLQAHRIERRVSVSQVVRRLAEIGHPITRETLSRVLNGKQPTSWDTVHALAEVLGVVLGEDTP